MSFPSVELVGPKVSGELIWAAVLAVLGANAAILIYIWLRFEWQFAVGAVVALVHDITVTVGIFALFQIKFDLAIIAALLTILGYSINDTVVVFDRLRENLIKFKKMPLRDVMNLSVNETLSRTVLTSGTTLIALIALLVLGGDVIRGFVFAITWGDRGGHLFVGLRGQERRAVPGRQSRRAEAVRQRCRHAIRRPVLGRFGGQGCA